MRLATPLIAFTLLATSPAAGAPFNKEVDLWISMFTYDSGRLYWTERSCGIPDANRLRVELIEVLSTIVTPASVEMGLERFDGEFRRMGGESYQECNRESLERQRKDLARAKARLLNWQAQRAK